MPFLLELYVAVVVVVVTGACLVVCGNIQIGAKSLVFYVVIVVSYFVVLVLYLLCGHN